LIIPVIGVGVSSGVFGDLLDSRRGHACPTTLSIRQWEWKRQSDDSELPARPDVRSRYARDVKLMSTSYPTTNDFLLPNGTFFVELALFLLVLFAFWKFVLPPLFESLRQREEMVRKSLEDREQAARTLHAAEERYDRALATARAEAASIRESAHADGRRLLIELRNQAAAERASTQLRADTELATQRERVIRELRPELGEVAMRLAGTLLGYKMTHNGSPRMVIERFLAEHDHQKTDRG
jgi:F-type H+-transporting ATPase subunit b